MGTRTQWGEGGNIVPSDKWQQCGGLSRANHTAGGHVVVWWCGRVAEGVVEGCPRPPHNSREQRDGIRSPHCPGRLARPHVLAATLTRSHTRALFMISRAWRWRCRAWRGEDQHGGGGGVAWRGGAQNAASQPLYLPLSLPLTHRKTER
ncbi:hypothetical protein E2C01_091675 [Portunus trituberculatus]|uniref:Uncharacterized protein n=1 Tax=Portunus trituberculatus TaxID=210409 RepID=A0A5B7JTH2_PORTR|nr:hypothetical protein [Portunus trituberculatus]